MTQKDTLDRFLTPQEATHAKALQELRMGLKLSHWIWWELPQLRELGKSSRAITFGLADLEEARCYLAHPILGARLLELCMALMVHSDKSPEAILGPVDAMKLRSMATLFAEIEGAPEVFEDILQNFFAGMRCLKTQALIAH